MGCCCCAESKSKYGAFRSEIKNPLLDSSSSIKLSPNAKVAIVRLICLRDIQGLHAFSGTSDPFVEMKLFLEEPELGFQSQLSSIKPSTICPKWTPPERFQFVVSNVKDAKVIVSVFHFNQMDQKQSTPLGDTLLKLKDFDPTATFPKTKTLKLINSSNGLQVGEADVSVQLVSPEDAGKMQEHTVYEYQRWNPLLGWGNNDPPQHLLITDRGRWCTEDGKRFGKTMEDVAPSIPPDWKVTQSWHTISTESDPDGWQYSITFDSPFWYAISDNGAYVVRRRVWQREVKFVVEETLKNDTDDTSSSLRRRRMFDKK